MNILLPNRPSKQWKDWKWRNIWSVWSCTRGNMFYFSFLRTMDSQERSNSCNVTVSVFSSLGSVSLFTVHSPISCIKLLLMQMERSLLLLHKYLTVYLSPIGSKCKTKKGISWTLNWFHMMVWYKKKHQMWPNIRLLGSLILGTKSFFFAFLLIKLCPLVWQLFVEVEVVEEKFSVSNKPHCTLLERRSFQFSRHLSGGYFLQIPAWKTLFSPLQKK